MYDFLQILRNFELNKILNILPASGKLLEIGAGAGWQAKRFSEAGFDVDAVDIKISRYKDIRVWPVLEYDGHHLPFPDDSFDIIFSSSVLEHIPHLTEFQNEIHRVLKSTGQAIHVVPSPSWRIWTSLAHYPYLLKTATRSLFNIFSTKNTQYVSKNSIPIKNKYSMLDTIRRALYSVRHGERGTTFSEIYYFSHLYWSKLFNNTDWIIDKRIPMRIIYSGYCVASTKKSLKIRQITSYFLGSSAIIYVLKQN